jgi:hypothetical protein
MFVLECTVLLHSVSLGHNTGALAKKPVIFKGRRLLRKNWISTLAYLKGEDHERRKSF